MQHSDLETLENLQLDIFATNESNTDTDSDIDPDKNLARYRTAANNITFNCKYYLEDAFKIECDDYDKNNFSPFHYNIRNCVSHHNELTLYLKTLNFKFSVLGLCETWLQTTNCD